MQMIGKGNRPAPPHPSQMTMDERAQFATRRQQRPPLRQSPPNPQGDDIRAQIARLVLAQRQAGGQPQGGPMQQRPRAPIQPGTRLPLGWF